MVSAKMVTSDPRGAMSCASFTANSVSSLYPAKRIFFAPWLLPTMPSSAFM